MHSSSTPSPSGSSDDWFYICLTTGIGVLFFVGVLMLLSLPWEKENISPYQLELVTETVPLSRQVLILVDNAGPPYVDSIRSEVADLVASLTEDQQVCLLQVGPDQAIMHQDPWCSAQIKTIWWVLPEIKPAPYVDLAEEKAYAKVRAKLEAELALNLQRAQEKWAADRVVRKQQVDSLLWQLPSQSYRSLTDSLIRLMEVRTLTGQHPTEVVIYSPLVDALYGQPVSQQVSLAGADVRIRVMTSEGEVGLARAVTEHGPWFNSGHPAKLDWSILEPKPEVVTRQSKAVHPAPSPTWGSLPPVVSKPQVADHTNVIQGEPVTGDATSVIREE